MAKNRRNPEINELSSIYPHLGPDFKRMEFHP